VWNQWESHILRTTVPKSWKVRERIQDHQAAHGGPCQQAQRSRAIGEPTNRAGTRRKDGRKTEQAAPAGSRSLTLRTVSASMIERAVAKWANVVGILAAT
jgi:hypothetical protein